MDKLQRAFTAIVEDESWQKTDDEERRILLVMAHEMLAYAERMGKSVDEQKERVLRMLRAGNDT